MKRQIKLLGTFELIDGGTPSPVMKRAKGCALLAYLIVTGHTQTREVVADLLWEADSTTQSLKNLRSLLPRIRPALPELIVTRQTLNFAAEPDTFVDFLALKKALWQKDVPQLEKTLPLYRGALMEDFYLGDSTYFNEWLLVEREKLHRQVSTAYQYLCNTYVEQEAWLKGIEAAQQWVTLDNLNEDAAFWLMTFLGGNGQLQAALRQYDQYRDYLWQELGTQPTAQITALAQQLEKRQSQATVQLAPATTDIFSTESLSELGTLPHNAYLPYHRNATFIGRSADLLKVAAHLQPKQNGALPKAMVISGMGGLGKTQLAVEYAYRYGRFFPGGVYWLNFADAHNISEEVAAIGGEGYMGLYREKEKLTLGQKVKRVRQAWQEKTPRLLIFDSCEDETVAATWMPRFGSCRVLLTSRRTAWPKEMPITELPLQTLTRAESTTLLQQLADHLLTKEAADIAAEVGDLPLALQLAGHFLGKNKAIQPQIYLAQLRHERMLQHPSLRGEFSRYSPTGHELHVARTFALSFDQLKDNNIIDFMSKQILAYTACLAPNEPIPLILLQQIFLTDNGDEAYFEAGIQRLLVLGFLSIPDDNTVAIHPLIATFAMDTVQTAHDMKQTKHVVAQAMLYQLQQYKEQTSSLITLPFATVHLRFVIQQTRANGVVAKLLNLLAEHLIGLADYQEAETCLQQAMRQSRQFYGEETLPTADIHLNFSALYIGTADYQGALPHVEAALTIHKNKLGLYHAQTTSSLNAMGNIRFRLGSYEEAYPYFEQAATIRETILGAEHPLTLSSLNNVAVMLNYMGNHEAARTYFERVLTVRERILEPDDLRLATTLNNFGDFLSRYFAEHVTGQGYLERAVAIRQKQLGPTHPLTLACLTNLGEVLNKQEDFETGYTYLTTALEAAMQRLGSNHPLTSRILNTLGVTLTGLGDFSAAQDKLEKALSIRESIHGNVHTNVAYTLICLGRLYDAQGYSEKARPNYQRALSILEQTVSPNHSYIQLVSDYLKAAEGTLRQDR